MTEDERFRRACRASLQYFRSAAYSPLRRSSVSAIPQNRQVVGYPIRAATLGLFLNSVEVLFKLWIAASATCDNFLGPIEIFQFALQRPFGWFCRCDLAHIADFIAELDQFRARGQVRRMLNLQALAFLLGQTLVVGYLLNKKANFLPEAILKLLR